MRRVKTLSAIALALAMLAGASAAHAQYGPEGRSIKRTGGPTILFRWYRLGPQYTAAIQPFFGVILDNLKTHKPFLDQLAPKERAILQNVRIEPVNNARPIFKARPEGNGGVIRLSQGSTYFIDTFANVMGRYGRVSDDALIALFLESEFRITDDQRWFNFNDFYALRGYPAPVVDEAMNRDITVLGRLMVAGALLHEICHILRGHTEPNMVFAKSLPLRRARELEADRCAADLMVKFDSNPEYAFTFSLALATIAAKPEDAEHPGNPERWQAMRAMGDSVIARSVAAGALAPEEAARYRAVVQRLQNVILMVSTTLSKTPKPGA